MRKGVFVLLAAFSMGASAFAFDLSFLPAYEHRVYHFITKEKTFDNHLHLYRTNETITVYTTNDVVREQFSFKTDGTPLYFFRYDKTSGALLVSLEYDWGAGTAKLVDNQSSKPGVKSIKIKNGTIDSLMLSEIIRGFPWGRDSFAFKVIAVEMGAGVYDATLKVNKKDVPVTTPTGDYAASILKMSAGVGFIKFEQKYEFYFNQAGGHELVKYDGVDATGVPTVSTLIVSK